VKLTHLIKSCLKTRKKEREYGIKNVLHKSLLENRLDIDSQLVKRRGDATKSADIIYRI